MRDSTQSVDRTGDPLQNNKLHELKVKEKINIISTKVFFLTVHGGGNVLKNQPKVKVGIFFSQKFSLNIKA